jgi:hypothetical protein
MTRVLLISLFWGGFGFLIAVAMWAVVTITRMRAEQAAAIGMLRVLAARAGLQEALEKVQTSKDAAHRAINDVGGAPPPNESKGG